MDKAYKNHPTKTAEAAPTYSGLTIWDIVGCPGAQRLTKEAGNATAFHLVACWPLHQPVAILPTKNPDGQADGSSTRLSVCSHEGALLQADADVLHAPSQRKPLAALLRRPLVVANAADTIPRLLQAGQPWPAHVHCLRTMSRLLRCCATAEGDAAPDFDLAKELAERGIRPSSDHGDPVRFVLQLKQQLQAELEQAGLTLVLDLETRLLPVTHRMQSRGIGVDAARLEQVRQDCEARAATAATELRAVLNRPNLNPNDNNAILAALQGLGLSVTGTSKRDLCRHLDHPAVHALQTYRELHGVHAAARTFLTAVGPDGRIHPYWDPFGAETGRYSCSEPAFQQLPKNMDLRRCFKPRGGFVFVACDLAQADLRPLASVSQDPEMLAIFKEGRDFHRETTAKLMGKPVAEVTDQERALSKVIVFGVVYGMGAGSLAEQALMDYGLIWTPEEAQAWMDRFFNIYTGLRDWRDAIRREAATATECRTLSLKRRRFLPTDPGQRGYRSRCLMNMPAQGTVADAIKQAMVSIAAKLHPEDAIIANMHDELLLEVRAERAEEVLKMVQLEMEKALAGMLSGVPVKTEAGIYASWAKEPMCEQQPAETTSEGTDQ